MATVVVGLAAAPIAWDRGRRLSFVIVTALVLGSASWAGAALWVFVHRRGGLESASPPSKADAETEELSSTCTWAICPSPTTSDELAALFGRVGTVTSAQVITDRETGRSRGFGFVEMSDDDARKAIDELTGATWAAARSP